MADEIGRTSLLQNNKVFMVLSHAGKPIFCCSEKNGIQNESHVADVMATAQALLSVSRSLGNGQHLKSIKSFGASRRTLYFLEKPHLLLFVATHHDESLLMLKMQLEMLHAQILSLLPMSGLKSLFDKSPGYDLRKLLMGSEQILRRMIDSFRSTPATVLGAYPMLPMSPGAREDMRAAVFEALVKARARFGVLIFRDAIVSNISSSVFRKSRNSTGLGHWDVLLLLNFVKANNASLSQGSETLTTLCMPFFNSHGNFYAYIRHIDCDTVLVLLSGDAIDDVYAYQDACAGVRDAWEHMSDTVILNELVEQSMPPEMKRPPMDTYHFIFKNSITGQYVWSADKAPEGLELDFLVVQYGMIRAGMFALDGESPSRGPLQAFRLDELDHCVFVAFASIEAEFFLCMKKIMPSEDAIEFAQVIRNTLVRQSSFLFSSAM